MEYFVSIEQDSIDKLADAIKGGGGTGSEIVGQRGTIKLVNNSANEIEILYAVHIPKEAVGTNKDCLACSSEICNVGQTHTLKESFLMSKDIYSVIVANFPFEYECTEETITNYDIIRPTGANLVLLITKRNDSDVEFDITATFNE